MKKIITGLVLASVVGTAQAEGQYGKAVLIGGLLGLVAGGVNSMVTGRPQSGSELMGNVAAGAVGGVVGRTMNSNSWNGAIAGGAVAGTAKQLYDRQTQPRVTGDYPQYAGQQPRYCLTYAGNYIRCP